MSEYHEIWAQQTKQRYLISELERAKSRGAFEYAAARLVQRYYRRFALAPWAKWDQTSVKDRWTRRGSYVAARVRLGGAPR